MFCGNMSLSKCCFVLWKVSLSISCLLLYPVMFFAKFVWNKPSKTIKGYDKYLQNNYCGVIGYMPEMYIYARSRAFDI